MVLVVGEHKQVALMPNTLDSSAPKLEATSRHESSRPTDGEDNEGGYRAKRYAVKYQPPCIFLEYEDANKKRRVRAVKLNGVQSNVDVDKLTRKVIRSFPRKLEPASVKYDQVRKLVVKLLEFLAAEEAAATGGASRTNGLGPGAVGPGRNGASHGPSRLGPYGGGGGSASHDGGSRLSDSSGGDAGGSFSSPLPAVSPRADPRVIAPLGGRLGPAGHALGLSGYHRGSVESSMSRFSTSTACSSRSGSGSGSDGEGAADGGGDHLASALDDLEREMGGGASTSGLSTRVNCSGGSSEPTSRDSSFSFRDRSTISTGPSPSFASSLLSPAAGRASSVPEGVSGPGAGAAAAAAKSRFAAENEKLTIGLEVTDDLDLNKVTEVELRMAKAVMEEDFRKNQLLPGDPGYVYDKQAEFGPPTEDNDWDDDEEEEPEASEEPEVDWEDIHSAVRKPTTVITAVNLAASSGDESTSPSRGRNSSQSPYNSNDWP